MSDCPSHSFRRCAAFDGTLDGNLDAGFDTAAVEEVRRHATTEVEPLAPFAGAAAFLFARSRSFVQQRVFLKELIETQANRHF
ncbi:hypothetical protein [Paraburkholderia saeva]|uniref:hypothetical protein n=1 Tax=Paraburkholderia saeva TaxID=2777537 RepID=UPI001E5B1A87|nr:hypothetical protein [Paraburkholderia saeva]